MQRSLGLALFLLLAGCGPSRQELMQVAQETCFSYGFDYGTPQFAQCVMQKDQQQAVMEMQRRQNVQQALSNMQQSLRTPEPVQMAPRSCRTYRIGNTLQTDCN